MAFITYRVSISPTPPGSNTAKGSGLTNAEIDGNFKSIDNDLATKAPLASPTFTGTVAGITKTMVGLANVDNTSDSSKPVSTAQAAAIALKQNIMVSGTDIKTFNGANILGSGNVVFQTPLVSNVDVKTINTASILGSGDVSLQVPLVSGTNIKTVNGTTILGSGDIVTATLNGTETLTNKTLTAVKEIRVAMAANNIDLSAGNVFSKTLPTGTTTFTVSNVPATGSAFGFLLDLTSAASQTVVWWTGVKWPGGTAPTLTLSGRDLIAFITHDGGTTWNAYMVAKALA